MVHSAEDGSIPVADMSALIARLEKGERGNALDVLIEVALFEPDSDYSACRQNNAGTKVIYTGADGGEVTFLARDWTMAAQRADVLAILKAKAQGEGG